MAEGGKIGRLEEFWEPDASFSKRSSLGVDMKKRSPMKTMTFKNGDGDLLISMRH